MLKEMRDAAGDSGEFYTPRPVIRFMVDVTDPKLGEVVLDPACGTGGFLVETYEHLRKQCNRAEDFEILQKKSILGGDAKPLPYLLCQMNLLLHGLEYPQIDPMNSLRFPLREIGDKDRVDIILTNPPFGGEEERGILSNFPEDKQSAETALLFLQLIMRKLRRGAGGKRGGRCGIVVPNGTLFGDGVCARIKKELIEDFNLHTIVRLPNGVFAPYTGQETNLLFFDRSGSTKEIWYYEHPLPPDRSSLKNPCYNKSKPLVFEEFEPLLQWWNIREANEFAWKVRVEDIIENRFNLDIRHPKHSGAQSIRTRTDVAISIKEGLSSFVQKSETLLNIVSQMDETLGEEKSYLTKTIFDLGVQINPENRNPQRTGPDQFFKYVDLSCVNFNNFEGVKEVRGSDAPSRARRVIRENDVIMSTVRPYLCGHAIVPADLDEAICSTGFSVLRCPPDLYPPFLYYMLISPKVIAQFINCMRGAHYPALNDDHVKGIKIPDIPLTQQMEIVQRLDAINETILPLRTAIEAFSQRIVSDFEALFPAILSDVYGDVIREEK